jgi:two-component system phosphate regulon response regulator PhoB
VLYRFPDLEAFERIMHASGEEGDLALPPGESVDDSEWVLAIFELGPGRRATSAAGLCTASPEGARLFFEPRDLKRLADFAAREREKAAQAPHRPSQAPSGPRSSIPDAGARVLIVDDDPDIRDVVSAMLEAVGLAVVAVESGEDAFERLHAEPFDLVVLDWNLPGISGLDLCRSLRRDPALGAVPVLFLTAHAASQDLVEAFAIGADDYVVKPFRAPELGARIFSLLRRARRTASG